MSTRCVFKGCVFPGTIKVRDINGDVDVCRTHKQFYEEEKGQAYDLGLAELRATLCKRIAPLSVSKETGTTADDGLGISGRVGLPPRSRKTKAALSKFAGIAMRARERHRKRENDELGQLSLRETLRLLLQLYRLRRRHHLELFREAERGRVMEDWRKMQNNRWAEWAKVREMVELKRKQNAIAALERKAERERLKPPKWTPYLNALAALPVGESVTFDTNGQINFSRRLRTMVNLSKKTYRFVFKTKTIGDQVCVHKVREWSLLQ